MADGVSPATTPIFDNLGNLYGATAYGGPCGCVSIGYGVVYELTPNGDGTWTDNNIFGFASPATQGGNPIGNIAFDKSGNLYGTTAGGGADGGYGAAFELSPAGGVWAESLVASFSFINGEVPVGVIMDSTGKLYGVTEEGGGVKNKGVVFEVVP